MLTCCWLVDRLTLAAAAPPAPRLLHRTLHQLVLHSWAELRRLLALPLLLPLLLRLCLLGLVLRSFGGHGGNYLAWQRRNTQFKKRFNNIHVCNVLYVSVVDRASLVDDVKVSWLCFPWVQTVRLRQTVIYWHRWRDGRVKMISSDWSTLLL